MYFLNTCDHKTRVCHQVLNNDKATAARTCTCTTCTTRKILISTQETLNHKLTVLFLDYRRRKERKEEESSEEE